MCQRVRERKRKTGNVERYQRETQRHKDWQTETHTDRKRKVGERKVERQTDKKKSQEIRRNGVCPGPVGQLVGALFCAPKGRRSKPRPGHIPRLWVQSLVGVCIRGNQSMFLSHSNVSLSLPFPLPLSLISINISSGEGVCVCKK